MRLVILIVFDAFGMYVCLWLHSGVDIWLFEFGIWEFYKFFGANDGRNEEFERRNESKERERERILIYS